MLYIQELWMQILPFCLGTVQGHGCSSVIFRAMDVDSSVISVVVMFHYYWCIRKPWSSSIILYNNNNDIIPITIILIITHLSTSIYLSIQMGRTKVSKPEDFFAFQAEKVRRNEQRKAIIESIESRDLLFSPQLPESSRRLHDRQVQV